MEFQLELGDFFGAEDFVPVRSAHVAADAEALRDDGIEFMSRLCSLGARCAIPTTTNPRSVDFERTAEVGQRPVWTERERRIVDAFDRMGARRCDTCINYQTVDNPVYGEHLAWGDTGTVIYANSVAGARSNFEAGPAAGGGVDHRTGSALRVSSPRAPASDGARRDKGPSQTKVGLGSFGMSDRAARERLLEGPGAGRRPTAPVG